MLKNQARWHHTIRRLLLPQTVAEEAMCAHDLADVANQPASSLFPSGQSAPGVEVADCAKRSKTTNY